MQSKSWATEPWAIRPAYTSQSSIFDSCNHLYMALMKFISIWKLSSMGNIWANLSRFSYFGSTIWA